MDLKELNRTLEKAELYLRTTKDEILAAAEDQVTEEADDEEIEGEEECLGECEDEDEDEDEEEEDAEAEEEED
jgi:hypothetical protein